jgi:hypothetical protein
MDRYIATASLGAVLIACFMVQPASARHLKHHRPAVQAVDNCVMTNEGRRICGEAAHLDSTTALNGTTVRLAGRRSYALVDQGTIIGSRPDGCPHSYCGCGLRKYLGLSDKRLNLAHNWARLFPHEGAPGAGLAAVRAHHVMYLESSAGNGQWMVRDYNSGGGLSRLHVREVRGYTLVNPHAQVAAR